MAARITTTDEQQQILDQEKPAPVFVVDANGQPTYVVLPFDEAQRMFDEYLQHKLQVGFDEAADGKVVDWNAEKIKAEGRRKLEQQQS